MQLRTTIVFSHGLNGLTDTALTGSVAKVFEGDAVEQAERLAELQEVFGTEFERGELTVDNLRPVLWAAHWLKAIRPVAQRASELLALAAERSFDQGSKAARDSDAVSRVMAGVATTEPHCLTAVEAAQKIRVPGDFYEQTVKAGCFSLEELSALRADGIRPLCEADPLALAEHSSKGLAFATPEQLADALREVQAYEDLSPELIAEQIFLNAHGASIRQTALLTPTESQALAEQIRSTAAAVEALGAESLEGELRSIDGAGSTVGADDSPFRLYGFSHDMLNALRLVHETTQAVGSVGCYPRVREALEQVSEVLLLIDGEAELQPSQEEFAIHELGQALIDNRGRSNEYELARRLHELGYRLVEGAAQ